MTPLLRIKCMDFQLTRESLHPNPYKQILFYSQSSLLTSCRPAARFNLQILKFSSQFIVFGN